jgi:formylglycine-generating enzyme required for sulfatase activity
VQQDIDCDRANYQVSESPAMYCTNGSIGGVNRAGFESPAGDGRWGHSDLAGNVFEWTLDYYGEYPLPCVNCADLTAGTVERVLRGGGFFNEKVSLLRSNYRDTYHGPNVRSPSYGLRCARTPSP